MFGKYRELECKYRELKGLLAATVVALSLAAEEISVSSGEPVNRVRKRLMFQGFSKFSSMSFEEVRKFCSELDE